jgi:hypothetical protein
MERRSTALIRVALSLLAAVFAFQVYRAATRPIGVGEAYLYDRFVRPTVRQVLASELPDRDVLYALLEKRSVGLFHVSPFAVRLPSLLFGILYLWSIWGIAGKIFRSGWWFASAVVVVAAIPLRWECFSRADGTGAALALLAYATCLAVERRNLYLIGICLGLSISANSDFLIPCLAMSGFVLAHWRSWWDWVDAVAIPAIVVTMIVLVLPLTHAQAPDESTTELTAGQAANLQSALRALAEQAGARHVRIGSIALATPVVNFYRAQHRVTSWEQAALASGGGQFDYYLLSVPDAPWAQQRHLIVVHRDGDFLVARAPM